jgi:chemosensory pili system protein ChpC
MIEQIYAVLLALEDDTLLLPNAAISEALSQDELESTNGFGPPWLLGWLRFGGERIPAVSFELLNGRPLPAPNRRARFAVINALGSRSLRQFAVLTQGYPHLITLNRTALMPAPLRPDDQSAMVLTRVRIASREVVIPDLEAVTAELTAQPELA